MTLSDPSGQPAPMRPDDFGSQTLPSFVTFKTKDNSPPGNLYVRQDELLGIRVLNGNASLTSINIGYRMLLANGNILHAQVNLPIAAGYTVQTLSIPLAEGYLLSAFVSVTASTKRGQCWVQLTLINGSHATDPQVALLTQGYAHSSANVAFPQSQVGSYLDGSGNMTTVTIANPAPGSDWSFTIGVGRRWRLQGVFAALTTSATVANRQPVWTLSDGTNIYWEQTNVSNITAGISAGHALGSGLGGSNISTGMYSLPLPSPCILAAGDKFAVATTNIQAADQWSLITLRAEEWIEA